MKPASPPSRSLTNTTSASPPDAPRKQIMELASLAFVERAENVVFLGPLESHLRELGQRLRR